MTDGVVVVGKPAGMTSHDVVARLRRCYGTRKVGHAGTLDPAATGVLVVGLGRATRLLGHLSAEEKAYDVVIRLGTTTDSDDADGAVVATAPPEALDAVDEAALGRAVRRQVGAIEQVPPAVSAVKVAGRRAYARARAGEVVELVPRRVVVHELTVHEVRRTPGAVDVVAAVRCAAGTYVRSLARDIGADLGVGGHVRSLHRGASGCFTDADATSLADLESSAERRTAAVLGLADVLRRAFPTVAVGADEARRLAHGGAIAATGQAGPVGVLGPDGAALALVADRDGAARPLVVLAPAR